MKKKSETPTVTIQNCNFDASNIFDASTTEALNNVTKSLLNLTELFKSHKVNSMLTIGKVEKETE